jgi:hypothetical protein
VKNKIAIMRFVLIVSLMAMLMASLCHAKDQRRQGQNLRSLGMYSKRGKSGAKGACQFMGGKKGGRKGTKGGSKGTIGGSRGSGKTVASFKQGNTTPAINGQTTNLRPQGGNRTPINVACGAVQAVLAHPTNANVCFAGAVNGGVWRTVTCTAPQPDWQPLTDNQESLSVSDMVFDSTDTSGNTILVAVGTRSSFGDDLGGPAIGLLYTQNALNLQPTWHVLDNHRGRINFRHNKVKFRSAFVRGSLMLAVAYNANPYSCNKVGVFRSTDSGITWKNVLSGIGLELAADPNDPNRFYAALDKTTNLCNGGAYPNSGVFTSADRGETWTFTSLVPGTTQMERGELNNAKLSVSSTSRVWSALLKDGVADSISYSDNQGKLWVKMDNVTTTESNGDVEGLNPRKKPGTQGDKHFSLLASPTNPNEVYVGGDRQDEPFPNFIGAQDYTGRLFRGDASVTATGAIPSPQWEHMTDVQNQGIPGGGTASTSAPHADSRDMTIRADGRLLESDDGGIAVRTSPGDNTGDWFSVCGNMQVFETHNIAYEPLNGTVLFGNQDTGTISGKLGDEGTFSSVETADGNKCMIDYTSDPDFSFFYFSNQRYEFVSRERRSKNTGVTTKDPIPLPNGFEGDFVTVAAMNPADQKVFAVAVRRTSDFNFDQIALTINRGSNYTIFASAPISGSITAMVWSDDGNVLYVASGYHFAACAFTSASTGSLMCGLVGSVCASVRHLAVNPDNSNEVYAATTNDDLSSPGVFVSTDGGSNWDDITILGSPVDRAAIGGSVAYIKKDTTSAVVVGTSNGVHVFDSTTMTWTLRAKDLPKVPVMDMLYEATDDRLVLGTLGRGVWYLDGASDVVSSVLTGFIP